MTGNIQCVVILSDADPLDLQFGDNTLISADAVRSFNKKTVGGVILLGCNAGHTDYLGYNLASAFAYKLGNSSPVMASDGSVYNPSLSGIGDAFTSKGDSAFTNCLYQNRSNKGWLIYSYANGSYYYNRLNQYSMSIKNMLSSMESYMYKYSWVPFWPGYSRR